MSSSKKRSYRELKKELDEVMYAFESSAHEDVDEMLKDHAVASKLIKEIEAYLDEAEVSLKKHKKSA